MPRYWSRHDEAQYKAILRSCRSGAKTCRRIAAATVNKRRAREGLGAVVPMATQGFKDGRKSWIVVKPKYGPPMRVTHEVLAELGALPPPVPPPSTRKCVAWRYVAGGRKCALFSDETGFRTAKPPARPLDAVFGG